MKRILTAALLFAALTGWVPPAAAQAIYRCGDSYSQQPCPGGKVVAADDSRSASQKSQTDQAVRRDAKAAEAMEKARLSDEAKPAQVLLPPARPQDTSLKPVAAPTLKKPEQFTAVAPKKPGEVDKKKKKKKATKRAA
ncbi:MAG: hypothetical protein K0Q43_3143 [Ramlibacter sp.]|jgi:hypothetical protein|nr:hypothetical protein [Ramlibacter sp.]